MSFASLHVLSDGGILRTEIRQKNMCTFKITYDAAAVCVVFDFLGLGWLAGGGGGSFVYCLCKFNVHVCRAASCDGFGYSGSPA